MKWDVVHRERILNRTPLSNIHRWISPTHTKEIIENKFPHLPKVARDTFRSILHLMNILMYQMLQFGLCTGRKDYPIKHLNLFRELL